MRPRRPAPRPGPGARPGPRPGPAAPSRPAAPEGVWLHGLHPVAAALANPARRLRRLLVTEEAERELAERVPEPWRIKPEPVPRERFASFLPADAVHQGAALLVEPLAAPPLEKLLADSSGPVVVLDQVTDPRNVGAILRSAAAFGAAALVMQDRHAPPETGALARAASGALEVVPILREVNLARAIAALKKAGCWVVGLEASGPVTLAQSGLSGRRVALVLGAEGEGLRRLTRDSCDELVRLPIRPAMESLNVAAAAAVALYELARE
ncbi:TrmH family RNA methyltransferase [Rubritepida flocculans]|uniref:TrmH family RNA methyltransferase n=1 Tax=Rubritepida flocculans TaxID=182403 RepID=UPI0004238EE7|nr:RNA methyltransferase [Rubritepida flocculans]